MEITIFSLNLNNYFDRPLQKMCLNTGYRGKENNKQIKDIKIFNEESIEYKNFQKVFEKRVYKYECFIEQQADAFRMYILSKYPNYLGLDGDVYITDTTIDWDVNFLFPSNFCTLFNGVRLKFYRDVFNIYLTENLTDMVDTMVCNKFNIPTINFCDMNKYGYTHYFKHLLKFDDKCKESITLLLNKKSKDISGLFDRLSFEVSDKINTKDKEKFETFYKFIGREFCDIVTKYNIFSRDIQDYGAIGLTDDFYNDLLSIKDKQELNIDFDCLSPNFDDTETVKLLEEDTKKLQFLSKLADIGEFNFEKIKNSNVITNEELGIAIRYYSKYFNIV